MNTDNDVLSKTTSATYTSDGNCKCTYTVKEIAELLQICKGKAYSLCKQNLFKTIKIGRVIRVLKLSFDEWLDGNQQ